MAHQMAKEMLVIDDRLYRKRDGLLREIVKPLERLSMLRGLHEKMGHICVNKLYHLARGLYEWLYLAENCAAVVSSCVKC